LIEKAEAGVKKYRHLYGPVPSRRLGRSLGIDLVPHKICTYDCIYCQIGKTTKWTLARREYVPVKEVLKEVKVFLSEGVPFDHFSLSGSGEPTLHSRIRPIIEGIKELSPVPVAVITNGSLLWMKTVRDDLLQADVVLPSLDGVSSQTFEKINRPHEKLDIEKVIDGMVEFRKVYRGQIWLEILFCKGVNDAQSELLKMKAAVERIQPDLIHLNTVVRPPSETWVAPLSQREMEEIQSFFGTKAIIISEFDRHPSSASPGDVAEGIVRILRRRPLSLSDLSKGMGISQEDLEKYLDPLVKDGKLRSRTFGDSLYYEVAEGFKTS
jgi:wyosine [tRNA(Phe)-imidazoG37] synthetase (radical SAM superfamily)